MNSYYEKMADGTIRCIDSDIPFEIPQGWEWCRLRNVCTVFGRIGFRGYTKNDIVDKGKGAITISPSNMMENGEMNFNCVSFISWFKYDESPEIQIAEKDILVVKTGSSYGKTCIVRGLPEKATINPQIAVLKFNFINPEILCYILNSPLCKEQFEKYVIGTSIPTFSQEKLSSTLIPLPPLNEQNRLVNIIGDLFGKTDVYCSLKERFDILEDRLQPSLKKSILQEAIQGRLVPQIASEGTAEELLAEIAEEKKRLVKEGKLKASALKQESRIFRGDDNRYYEQIGLDIEEIEVSFNFPDSWSICRLRDLCQLTDGEKTNGSYPCLDAKYLRGKSTAGILTGGKFVYKYDNIILVDGENSGEVFTVPCDGYMGSTFKQLWISSQVDKDFILLIILFYKSMLRNSKKGAAIPHLNKELFYNITVGLPPLHEQQRIVQECNHLFNALK